MKPLVSVITPAYNCEKYIEEAILSVIGQTYQNWEHIIVDDGSKDNTNKKVKKYAKLDKRIRIIELQKNGGVARARNQGIACAAGTYIAFLDSDDQWKPEKLEKQINFMLKYGEVFSYTSYDVVDERGKYIKRITPFMNRVGYRQLLRTNVMACCTIIIKADLLKRERMPEIKHEDYATWLNILKKYDVEAVCLQEPLAIYRRVNTSVSANKWKTIGWCWNIYHYNQGLNIFSSLKYLLCFVFLTSLKYLKK